MKSKNIKIAFLGLGAMGSRMATNLLNAGFDLTVWNRTAATADALVKSGARQASSPKEAAYEADYIISMVRDNEAAMQVWLDEQTWAIHGMKSGAIAIESSTLTPACIKDMAIRFNNKGFKFLEAPVSGSRPQAAAAQLVYFVAGDKSAFEAAKPILEKMGSTILFIGNAGNAAITKLITNALLGIQVTAISELIGLIKSNNADPALILDAISKTSSWAPVNGYLSSTIFTQNFAPQFPVELISKDFDYIKQISKTEDKISILSKVSDVFHQGISVGLGDLNMTGISKLY